jgi:hypothetical protein
VSLALDGRVKPCHDGERRRAERLPGQVGANVEKCALRSWRCNCVRKPQPDRRGRRQTCKDFRYSGSAIVRGDLNRTATSHSPRCSARRGALIWDQKVTHLRHPGRRVARLRGDPGPIVLSSVILAEARLLGRASAGTQRKERRASGSRDLLRFALLALGPGARAGRR